MANTFKFGNGEWAVGKETALAYNDENNNFKPLPFSFDRGSIATVVNKDGLIETVGVDEPRIDFLNNTKGHLLLEPSRQNKITYSEDFSQWQKLNSTITSNSIISPDGGLNADKIVDNTVNTAHRVISNSFSTTATNYTFSVFLKMSEIRYAYLRGNDSGGSYIKGTFDLQEGVVTEVLSGDLSIQDYGNGWFRVIGTATSNANGASYLEIRASKTPIYSNYLGSGTDGLYLWGAQVEEGSYATSYIPTSGQANGVTRVREEVNNENYLMSGLTDMAMFVDYELPNGNSSGFRNQLGFRDNNNANFYMIQFPNSNTYEFRYTGVANVNVDMTPSISEQDFGLRRKLLYTKTGTTLKVFCNGVQVSTVTNASATTFSTTSEILNAGANYDIEIKIKDWKLYNNGFTDAEAIALTTI